MFERNFETARIFVMEGSKQVLVKVMLFQLREHVHPQDGAMLTFFHEWSSPLLVLSIDVSFVLKFFWKGDKNLKNWTSGPIYMEDPVYLCLAESYFDTNRSHSTSFIISVWWPCLLRRQFAELLMAGLNRSLSKPLFKVLFIWVKSNSMKIKL